MSFEIKKQDKQKQKEEIFYHHIWATLDKIVMFWMRMIKSDFAIVGLCLLLRDKLIQYM